MKKAISGMDYVATMLGALVLASSAACGGGPIEDESTAAQRFSVTEVTRDPDGSPRVTTRWITAAEQQAENQARAGRTGAASETGAGIHALVQESVCTGPSIWLYDGPGQTGNRICLRPSPPSQSTPEWNQLREFPRPVSICPPIGPCRTVVLSWEGAVRSYWDPSFIPFYTQRRGMFVNGPCSTWFDMDSARHEADACVRSAIWIGTFIDGPH